MPYKHVPRRRDGFPDAVAWKKLGLTRSTFFRRITAGMPVPEPTEGTRRRWWRDADVEYAREHLIKERTD
jgi:predicted DNA-binding transcriptional regulator AlpA